MGASDAPAAASADVSMVVDGFAEQLSVQDDTPTVAAAANAQASLVDVMDVDKENQGDDAAQGEVEDANPKVNSPPMHPAHKPCA